METRLEDPRMDVKSDPPRRDADVRAILYGVPQRTTRAGRLEALGALIRSARDDRDAALAELARLGQVETAARALVQLEARSPDDDSAQEALPLAWDALRSALT